MSLNKRALGALSAAVLALGLAACSGASSSSSAESVPALADDMGALSAPTEASAPVAASDIKPIAEPAPEGYSMTSVNQFGFSFATPSEWQPIEVNPGTPEYEAIMQVAADKLGIGVDQIKAQAQGFAAFLMTPTPDETGFSENLNVNKQVLFLPKAPSEAEVRQLIEMIGTAESVETRQTALGPAVFGYYIATVENTTVNGASVIVPTAKDGEFAQISIASSDLNRAKELADVIAKTLTK